MKQYFSDVFKSAKAEKNITNKQLQEKLKDNVTIRSLQRYATGEQVPSPDRATDLLRSLGIKMKKEELLLLLYESNKRKEVKYGKRTSD